MLPWIIAQIFNNIFVDCLRKWSICFPSLEILQDEVMQTSVKNGFSILIKPRARVANWVTSWGPFHLSALWLCGTVMPQIVDVYVEVTHLEKFISTILSHPHVEKKGEQFLFNYENFCNLITLFILRSTLRLNGRKTKAKQHRWRLGIC